LKTFVCTADEIGWFSHNWKLGNSALWFAMY